MVDKKPSSQLPLPGIALVAIVLGVFVFTENAFVPTRPDASSEIASTAEGVRTQLWQDPFETTERHRRTKHSGEADEQLQRFTSGVAEYSMYQNHQHQVCDLNPSATIRDNNILAQARLKVEELVYKNADFQVIGDEKKNVEKMVVQVAKKSAHTIDELRCQIQREYEKNLFEENFSTLDSRKDFNVHVLAVMVHGGPDAEDKESRIRSRYAVISGLSRAGYHPYDTENIGYVDTTSLCKLALKNPSYSQYCDWPETIPYEWYKHTEAEHGNKVAEADTLLILWLNDEEVSERKPLALLQQIRDSITPGKLEKTMRFKIMDQIVGLNDINVRFDVLGPANSKSLGEMYQDASEVCFKDDLQSCEKAYIVLDDVEESNIVEENYIRIFSSRATIDNATINKKLNTSLTASDRSVQWINIYPGDADDYRNGWFNIKRTISTDKVLVADLLCELLRRGINPYYREVAWLKHSHCDNFFVEGLNIDKRQDYVVLIGEFDTEYSRNFYDLFYRQIKERSDNREPAWLLRYNYFRGIDGSIGKNNSELSSTDTKRSEKVSLRRPVGEYQYDYLRRLSHQLIKLSASIADDGVIRAIGIVGSDTYDKLIVLQALRDKFPDVVFFTTDLDARMLHAEENQWARNLIVASGYGLKPEGDMSKGLMPFRDGYQTSLFMATLMATNIIDDSGLHLAKSKTFEIGNKTAIASSSTDTNQPNIDYGLHVFLLLLLLLLMFQASRVTRIYLLLAGAAIYVVFIWIGFYHPENSAEYREMWSGTSIWPPLILKMFAAVLSAYFIVFAFVLLNKNTKKIKLEYDVSGTGSKLDMFTRMCISGWGRRYISGTENEASRVHIRELLAQYFTLGNTLLRVKRVMLMLGVYCSLTFLIAYSFPEVTYAPYSDKSSALAQFSVVPVAIFLYFFLIFLVVDVTRLNANFVFLVSECKVTWPPLMLEKFCQDYGVDKRVAEEKIKLNLIVSRSKAVDMLIYLPFIVLTLMIISSSTYFDRWYAPVPSALIMLFGACIALSSAIRLRRSAERMRSEVLENLGDMYKNSFTGTVREN